jgi:hypothetical protein
MKLTKQSYLGTDSKLLLQGVGYEIWGKHLDTKRAIVMAWRGVGETPVKNVWVKPEILEDYTQQLAWDLSESVRSSSEWKEKRKAEANRAKEEFKAKLVPGAILERVWGYEQTNVNFYQIISVKGSKVTFSEIEKRNVEDCGYMSGKCVAVKDEFIGEVKTTIVRGARLTVNDWDYVSMFWDGKPVMWTSYH